MAQGTTQATNKTTWNSMTSDQSLAGSHPLRIEKTIHNTVYTIKQTQVTMQATRLNIHGSNHKRPVACKVARFEDKTNIQYINRHVASDHRNIHEGIISDQVASTKTSQRKLKCLYCLRAAKPCLSAKCLFNRFGREYGPSPQPSTGQG